MTSPMTIADMEALAALVATSDNPRRSRWLDWIATAIDVRLAQQTKSGTAAHRDLMDAYRAEVQRWFAAREQAAVDYAAERADFEDDHPRPTLKAFLLGHRQHLPNDQPERCPVCGMPQVSDEQLAELLARIPRAE